MKAQLLFSTLAIFLTSTLLTTAQPYQAELTNREGNTIRTTVTRTSPPKKNDEGRITQPGTLTFQVNNSTRELPFRLFTRVELDPLPQAFLDAEQQVKQNNLILARPSYETVLRQFDGLPADFVGITYTRLADIYISQEKYEEAEKFLQQYAQVYADADTDLDQVALGQGQIAVAKREFQEALDTLEPLTEIAKNHESVSEREANFFARVFFSLGEAQRELGNLSQALENYLKVVTIYFHDTALAEAAKERADQLRTANPGITVP